MTATKVFQTFNDAEWELHTTTLKSCVGCKKTIPSDKIAWRSKPSGSSKPKVPSTLWCHREICEPDEVSEFTAENKAAARAYWEKKNSGDSSVGREPSTITAVRIV